MRLALVPSETALVLGGGGAKGAYEVGVIAALEELGIRAGSVFGVSIGGAAAHNTGQIAAACITLGNTAVLGYLPVLLGVSLLTGTITGLVSALLFRAMHNIHLSHP